MAISDADMRKATALYWNVAEAAARLGSTTYELWVGLRTVMEQQGLESVGVPFGAISRLRGQAGAIVRASQEFAAASRDQQVTPEMVGLWTTARDLATRNLSPETMIRGTRTYVDGGVQVTSRFTFKYGQLVGRTAGDVIDLVTADAQSLTDQHEQTFLGIGSFEIIAM